VGVGWGGGGGGGEGGGGLSLCFRLVFVLVQQLETTAPHTPHDSTPTTDH
jgi:hypothetical protein